MRMFSGHETFSNATEPECEKAYAAFKQHMEQIHLALTTHDHTSLAGKRPPVKYNLYSLQ